MGGSLGSLDYTRALTADSSPTPSHQQLEALSFQTPFGKPSNSACQSAQDTLYLIEADIWNDGTA